MKIVLLIFVVTVFGIANGEYKKFKVRGGNGQQHRRYYPEAPHYATKKWQQQQHHHPHHMVPPRPPLRAARPIPVHMSGPSHKISHGVPIKHSRPPVVPPSRNYWKNTPPQQNKFKSPVVEQQIYVNTQKQATVPPIQEFDRQIHSNVVSTHTNPIKQIGDKGPIHTIPAPNLSLADKPSNINLVSRQQPQQPQIVQQYQVTEAPEPQRVNPVYYPTEQQQIQVNQEQQPDVYLGNQINPKELFQLLQQPGLLQTYQIHDNQNNYQQLLNAQPQLFQPEVNYIQQSTQTASDKIGVQAPEYHSFNYEEQQQQQKSETVPKETLDPIAQAQYIQKFFDTRENEDDNDVEPDAKPADENKDLLSSEYFASLPNKDAAEKLAQLQTAGKINSNLMKMGKNRMTIYVPDETSEHVDYDGSNNEDMEHEENRNVEDENDDEISEESSEFGHRIQPK